MTSTAIMTRGLASTDPFQLASDDVHLWRIRLALRPATIARLGTTLTSDERERSDQIRVPHDRDRFIVAHAALRDLLARYLRTSLGKIRYVCTASGKPELDPSWGGAITFNLSHSAELALIAIAAGRKIGVDVERVRPRSDYVGIARRFLSSNEMDALAALPKHRYARAFLQDWTRKEAYLKARGEAVGNGRESDYAFPIVAGDQWSFHTLRPAPRYVGALAVEGDGCRLGHWNWRARWESDLEPQPLAAPMADGAPLYGRAR